MKIKNMQMKKLKKDEKGSMAVYVTVVLITFLIILSVLFASSTSIRKMQLNTLLKIKEAYESDYKKVEEVYQEQLSKLGKPLATLTEIQDDKVEAVDTLGNKVVVPKGFRVVNEEDTVQDGIVIEDGIGNQYVWVPVSSTKRGNTETLIVIEKDGVKEEVNIILGRYTFKREKNSETGLYEDGTPTLEQAGEEYASPDDYTIETNYKELNDGTQESNGNAGENGTNTAFKDLKGFVDSVEENKGYYIARYEASYGGGTTTPGTYSISTNGDGDTVVNSIITDQKLCSVESTANSETAMSYEKTGTLWNYITQGDAAKVCRNMYTDNNTVKCDLTNSYAWDTAIVFIQKCSGNSNYANEYDGNGILRNTGTETGDVECNIYDMTGNLSEWTTENSTDSSGNGADPCVGRGGCYYLKYYTSGRYSYLATHDYSYVGFRALLYAM